MSLRLRPARTDLHLRRQVWQRFFTAAVALGAPEREVAFVVPTGNFGDAYAAFVAVRDKVDDFFTRCRLAAFDPRAGQLMNGSEDELRALAARNLAEAGDAVAHGAHDQAFAEAVAPAHHADLQRFVEQLLGFGLFRVSLGLGLFEIAVGIDAEGNGIDDRRVGGAGGAEQPVAAGGFAALGGGLRVRADPRLRLCHRAGRPGPARRRTGAGAGGLQRRRRDRPASVRRGRGRALFRAADRLRSSMFLLGGMVYPCGCHRQVKMHTVYKCNITGSWKKGNTHGHGTSNISND